MKTRTGILKLVPLGFFLLPTAVLAQAQGTVGPLQQFSPGSFVTSGATAGSLAFFITVIPTAPPQPFIRKLLRSDGTPEGTFALEPTASRFVDSLGNLMFYTCADLEGLGLCRSDGTAAGTFLITQGLSLAIDSATSGFPVALPFPERGVLFFSAGARSASPDFELWATDGTPAGTHLVEDVNPAGASNPRSMTAFGGRLFFLADTPGGRELWESDGTPEGTERVFDFHEGTAVSLAAADGALFVLVASASDLEVWRSDGTEAGTVRVLDLASRLHDFRVAGRNLFFFTRDADGQELWAVGGEGAAVRVLEMGTFSDSFLFPVGDHLAFTLEDDHGWEPWWSDGTPQGTRRIADICPGPCGSSAYFIGNLGGRAVFAADDGISGVEPWLTDGTAAGTWRLGDLCPGACSSFPRGLVLDGWLVLLSENHVWVSDGTPDGAWSVGDLLAAPDFLLDLPDRVLFAEGFSTGAAVPLLAALPVTAPAPPPGAWLESARVLGFRFKVLIDGQITASQQPSCMAQTLCASGAQPGRSEVFARVVPGANGRLWPTVIKLTTSAADVWVRQTSTGNVRHYRLNGSGPTGSTLEGTLDREGFELPDAPAAAVGEAKAPKPPTPPKPPGRWISYPTIPGFRVQARLTEGGKSRLLRKEACIAETFCLGSIAPGPTELLVRVTGPRPNGFFWPMLARFVPATLEVWVQQRKTGKVRYYRMEAPPAGSSDLDGLVDRLGFKR